MKLSMEYNMKAKNPLADWLTSRKILGTTELIAMELGSFVLSLTKKRFWKTRSGSSRSWPIKHVYTQYSL